MEERAPRTCSGWVKRRHREALERGRQQCLCSHNASLRQNMLSAPLTTTNDASQRAQRVCVPGSVGRTGDVERFSETSATVRVRVKENDLLRLLRPGARYKAALDCSC
jgi:hypothetical protein